MTTEHAEHFASFAQQREASRVGMWVFLVSESLLFAGLFMLYSAYRLHAPGAFHEAIQHSTKILGSINTAVLLLSSTLVALAVHLLRGGRSGRAALLVAGTIALGAVFVAIKLVEYAKHLDEGVRPGDGPFWTLYYVTTGLHAIHVLVGMTVLALVLLGIAGRRVHAERVYVLENAALYWHLVDVIWIFLWPLYYLT